MDNYLFLPRALAAALSDTAFAVAVGLALLGIWLPSTDTLALATRLHRWLWACTAAMLLALPIQMYLMTAAMLGTSSFAQVRPMLATAIGETHAGRALLMQLAALILLALLLATMRNAARPWAPLAALLLLAATRAASGHAASDGDFTLREIVQWLHLASIAVWSGGVIAAGFLAVPALLRANQPETIVVLMRRLSTTVTFALALIILSGIYNAYHGLGGSLTPLRNTQWGLLLDAKSLLVLAAVIVGAMNRRMLRPAIYFGEPQTKRLATLLRAEAIVMLLILTLSAFLANSPPADMSAMAM